MPKAAEVVTLLDLVKIIIIKVQHINLGLILITIDSGQVYQIINGAMKTANQYIQDAATKVAIIIQLIRNTLIEIKIQVRRGHSRVTAIQDKDPGAHMIIIAH